MNSTLSLHDALPICWDRGLRDRMFQFSPVYVSAESMRWWLGRECFAKQNCILSTREEGHQEDAEDEIEEYYHHPAGQNQNNTQSPSPPLSPTRPSRFQ